MPPKSKKPGVAKQFLLDNFSHLPDPHDFLNGHVLYLHVLSCNQRRAATTRKLLSLLPPVREEQVSTVLSKLSAAVRRVDSQTMGKFRKLTDPKELQKFSDICNQKFSFDLSASKPKPSALPSTSSLDVQPSANPLSESPLETRQTAKCKSCRIHRASLKSMREKQRQLQKEKQQIKRNMTAGQKKKNGISIKVLRRTIKRKEIKISTLKAQVGSSKAAQDLAQTKKALSLAEKRHKTLKKYNKEAKSKLVKRLSSEYEMTKSILKEKLDEKDEEICYLQNEKLVLEEQVQDLQEENKEMRADGKTYSSDMRMMVYDAVINQVPTNNVPKLIEKFSARCGLSLSDVPHRTTVECMTRELGVIAELQAAEAIVENKNCTLGFDATTQEGVHINSIHVTTESDCYAVAVDELPGGTAEDYHLHICDSVDNLAAVYCHFHEKAYPPTRKNIIDNITNSMTDRCAANHATIELVNSSWDKTLNELNCHLHPLDSLATKTKTAMKQHEQEQGLSGKLFGSDCIAGNIVVELNKMRYKDGKGDPRGFTTFLDSEGLPRGLLPRYRGNRLHILFHTAGVLVHYHQLIKKYLEKGTACGGLRQSILADFQTTTAHVELQVLGLVGKLLTGPWMQAFYTSAADQMAHIEGIGVVKNVVRKLSEQKESPLGLLSFSKDFFGNRLHEPEVDATLSSLMQPPQDESLFKGMMKSCLQAVVEVLERQYSKYFDCDVTEKLRIETKSARSHNIDAEEIMGMFSAAKKKAPNATLCYISSKMRAQKNRSVDYLDGLSVERREVILKKVIQLGQKQRKKRRVKQKDLRAELMRREIEKQQAREASERRKVERKLKNTTVDKLREEFPEIDKDKLEKLVELLSGRAVGKEVCLVWSEDGSRVVYNGRIEKVKSQGKTYVIGYWLQSESYEDATDYDVSVFQLGADLIAGDLLM